MLFASDAFLHAEHWSHGPSSCSFPCHPPTTSAAAGCLLHRAGKSSMCSIPRSSSPPKLGMDGWPAQEDRQTERSSCMGSKSGESNVYQNLWDLGVLLVGSGASPRFLPAPCACSPRKYWVGTVFLGNSDESPTRGFHLVLPDSLERSTLSSLRWK